LLRGIVQRALCTDASHSLLGDQSTQYLIADFPEAAPWSWFLSLFVDQQMPKKFGRLL